METILTPQLATEIAVETSIAAGYDVLLTDTTGRIIGSNRTERLGNMHPPSIGVSRTGVTVSRSKGEIDEHGVRPGITMPIELNGLVIGTVALAGPPRTVRRLGRLVQRQTQILLRESAAQRSEAFRESAVVQLVRDIMLFDDRVTDSDTLLARAADLGFRLTGARVAVVVQADGAVPHGSTRRAAREVFAGHEDIVAETAAGSCTILHAIGSAPEAAADTRSRCYSLVATLEERARSTVHIGIGSVGSGVDMLRISCTEAASIARLGLQNNWAPISGIDDVRVPLLLDAVPPSERDRFVAAVLGSILERSDADELLQTVRAWVTSGCNLAVCARLSQIHRNTVIYRLDKLHQLLGLDLRIPKHAVTAYLAALLVQ